MASIRVLPRDERGFTLIEVIVAATLVITVVLGTFVLLDRSSKTTAVSKQRDVANALAQEMVERATGGRYTLADNDMTNVVLRNGTPEGPADRLHAALDPDGDQQSIAVTPQTPPLAPQGSVPSNQTQSWSLQRKYTTYTVSYRACTMSDSYRKVEIAGPFDCTPPSPPPGPPDQNPTAPGGCSIGLVSAAQLDAQASALTARVQVLGAVGLNVCVGAASLPLAGALCDVLGGTSGLNGLLTGSGGLLGGALGGVLGSQPLGGCAERVEQEARGAIDGIATQTKVIVTVGWKDVAGDDHDVRQTALIRRAVT